MSREFIGTSEIARAMGVTVTTVRSWARPGSGLNAVQCCPKGKIRFLRHEVLAWLRNRGLDAVAAKLDHADMVE